MSRPNKRQRQQARLQRKAERKAAGLVSPGPAQSRQRQGSAEPVRGALAPVIDDSLSWHMARTAFRMGPIGRRALDDALKAGEVAAYRPRVSEVVIRRGRRVVRHVPLLLRTLIIGVRDADHLGRVRALPGVAEIVTYPGPDCQPARLDPEELQRFLIATAAREVVQPVGIKVGQSVVVTTGPFASFPAVVEEILPNDRVRVGIAIFGRPSPAVLGIADVQVV